jgi:hypothetical protein
MKRPRRLSKRSKRIGLWATAGVLLSGLVAVSVLPATAATTRYEAENATVFEGAVNTDHTGYSGTGFVVGDAVAGSYVEFTVHASSAGTMTVGVRYANGTADDRSADVAVNGTTAVPAISFPGTGSWNTWATSTVNVRVASGGNKIRLTATTANGLPNLDYIDVQVAVPPVDPSRRRSSRSPGAGTPGPSRSTRP